MSLHDKLKSYPKEYDLSDIHIRSNQPFAIRENGEIKVFNEDIISRQDIETFWKQSLDKAQYDYLISNGDLDFAVVVDVEDRVFKLPYVFERTSMCVLLRILMPIYANR